MHEKWFPTIRLRLTKDEFERLPNNPAYKYEYFNDEACLTPRPKFYLALLNLQPMKKASVVDARGRAVIRHIEDRDWDVLPRLLVAAFHRVQPIASLDENRSLEAARQWLDHTRTGGDGPLIGQACFVAVREEDCRLIGTIIITLQGAGDLTEWDGWQWPEAPPADAVEKRLGRPSLTWVFVAPLHSGHGVGANLLAHAVDELLMLGYKELASGFLLGNESSMLWHWRNGFQLLSYPGSLRRFGESLQKHHCA